MPSATAIKGRVRPLAGSLVRTHVFERRWGAGTDGEWVYDDALGLHGEEWIPYVPSPWLVLPSVLRHRPPRPSDVFLDIGCGKGRVVLQAASYPYRRVIGLDVSPLFAQIARENVERNRGRFRATEVEIVNADIITYSIPDDVTTVYCYNAVAGRPLEALMRELRALAGRRGEPVTFIYNNPTGHDLLLADGGFRHDGTLRPGLLTRGHCETRYYTVLAPGAGA